MDDYISQLDRPRQKELLRIRKIVKQLVPDAEEMMSYGMPTFKYKKRPLLYMGSFKDHMSIFPASSKVVEQLGDKLKNYHTSKGTLSFKENSPVPEELLKDIIKIRLAEITKK